MYRLSSATVVRESSCSEIDVKPARSLKKQVTSRSWPSMCTSSGLSRRWSNSCLETREPNWRRSCHFCRRSCMAVSTCVPAHEKNRPISGVAIASETRFAENTTIVLIAK